jgi:hypothetical protein
MTPETQKPARALLLSVLLFTSVALLLGYALKANCTDRPWDGRQWTTLCANDVDLLYSLNDLQHVRAFPPDHIEYPPVVVLLVGATAALAHSAAGFVQLNGIVAAGSGLAAAAMLTRLAPGRRSLLFALGPPLILYSFQNWDLLAVALTIACFYLLFARGNPTAAGISLGLGAAVKLFPALLLPALIVHGQREAGSGAGFRPTPRVVRLGGGFLAGAVLPNLFLWSASHTAWSYFWSFQADRFPNPETSWFMIFRHLHGSPIVEGWWTHGYAPLANIVSGLLFLLIAGIVLVREAREPEPRLYELCLAIIAIFLLTAKVFSPQYMLWLLPLFALVRLSWRVIAASFVVDVAVVVATNWYFLEVYRGGPWAVVLDLLEVTVWARYAVLIWVVWASLRTRERPPA